MGIIILLCRARILMSGKVINKGNNNKNIEAGRDVNIFNSYSGYSY